MRLKRIISTLRHPTSIKIISLLVIVWFFFILPVFAGSETTDSTTYLAKIQENINFIVNLCSRARVILAILAGKLMTNDRVYGSIVHMDIYLRKIWNIMKNFANFGLIAIILYKILSGLIGKKSMDMKSIITKTLIAGVLIQASRFLVWAVVDLSTIATAAIGSFPSQFLNSDTVLNESIQNSLKKTPRKYTIDLKSPGLKSMFTTDTSSNEQAATNREDILPTYNSISWPLFYFWFSVFKFQGYMGTAGTEGASQLTMAFLLRMLLILIYTLGLGLLFIANAIRVAFLWMFIIASPIIILSKIFFDDKWLSWWGGKWLMQYLSFEVMMDLILKPIIFVAGFSMILIFVVSMQNVMNAAVPKSFNGVTLGIASGESYLQVADIADVTLKESQVLWWNVADTTGAEQIKNVGETTFVNLILFFITAFLVRTFVKISVTSGKGPIADTMKSLTKTLEWFMKTLPIVPLWWGASITSLKYARDQNFKNLAYGMGMNEQGQFGEYDAKEKQFQTYESKFKDFISGGKNRSPEDFATLSDLATTNPESFLSTSSAKAADRKVWLSLTNNAQRLSTFEAALKKPGNPTKILWSTAKERNSDTDKSLDDYMNQLQKPALRKLYKGLSSSAKPDKDLQEVNIKRSDLKKVTFKAESE